MERRRIVLFIFGVIALLAVLCSFFPADGIQILGDAKLRFPKIKEVIGSDVKNNEKANEILSPEELIAQREAAIKKAKKGELEKYLRNDPARIHMPGDDLTYLDKFFKALDNADKQQVRIVHYGDSQLEEDRITCTIRDRLQTEFGGGGVGLLPAIQYVTLREGQSASAELPIFMAYGSPELRAGTNRYGPMAKMSRFSGSVTFTTYPFKVNTGAARYFNRITVYAGNLQGTLYGSAKGLKKEAAAGGDITKLTFNVPDSTTKASVTLSGAADLYGISFDNDHGICVDNVPMRGCSGTIFTTLNANQLSYYFKNSGTRMIIMQYGGNSVPYTKTTESVQKYCASIRKQIELMKKVAPDAVILFIGPSDMSTSIGGKRQTYPILPEYIDALRKTVNECGAAYWDLYQVMGGKDSMIQWVNASPALAGTDYIHFTPKGSEKVGNLFTDELMLYYDYYNLRKR